ncbi:uncharacterized protein [Lepeophtheirus salmonis]|uniref:uncharacterized protein n=1 Tax=Lepeophtheirus salmonis TaxID=72036 RepID=UPI003AF3C172
MADFNRRVHFVDDTLMYDKQLEDHWSITDIRSLFGLVKQVTHYRRMKSIMEPFKALLSPKRVFSWSFTLNDTFLSAKELIIKKTEHGVRGFDLKKATYLTTDWSNGGLGYYLSQKHCQCQSRIPECCSDEWKITLVGSRFLCDTEKRYASVEGEM